MSELKEILRDPWHVLVFEPLTGDSFVSTYGSGEYELVEKVDIKDNDELRNWIEKGIIYYSDIPELNNDVVNAQFCDAWREDAYEPQEDSAYASAVELGIQCNPSGYREE